MKTTNETEQAILEITEMLTSDDPTSTEVIHERARHLKGYPMRRERSPRVRAFETMKRRGLIDSTGWSPANQKYYLVAEARRVTKILDEQFNPGACRDDIAAALRSVTEIMAEATAKAGDDRVLLQWARDVAIKLRREARTLIR